MIWRMLESMKIKSLIRKKINSRLGFNLAETLMTVLLLSIVLSAVTGGIEAARRAYKNVRLKSDAQMLLATTITEISTEFERARDLQIGDNNVVLSYYSEYRGGKAVLQNDDTNGIKISLNDGEPVSLVTEGTRGIETLYTKFTSADKNTAVADTTSTEPDVPYFISDSTTAETSGYIRYTIKVYNQLADGEDQELAKETVCVRPALFNGK